MSVRQQLFRSLATPYLGKPPDLVELYRVGLAAGMDTKGFAFVGSVLGLVTVPAILVGGVAFFTWGGWRPIILVAYAALAFGLVRMYRAWRHAPNDVLVAVNDSEIAVLRASMSLFRDWHVLNVVGVWPRQQVQVAVIPNSFELRITPPSGETLPLEPSPLTGDSIALARLLAPPAG